MTIFGGDPNGLCRAGPWAALPTQFLSFGPRGTPAPTLCRGPCGLSLGDATGSQHPSLGGRGSPFQLGVYVYWCPLPLSRFRGVSNPYIH